MLVAIYAFSSHASGLVPKQCSVGDKPICYPISEIFFDFEATITVSDNSTAIVYSENHPIATGYISASNYHGKYKTQGTAIITFDTPLILPKGQKYSLVVPEKVIFKEDNPAIFNDMITVDFEVPDNLGEAKPTVKNGSVVKKANNIGFNFMIETAAVEDGEILLYRKDVPLKKYPVYVSWDWNLGYAGLDFGETVNFEKGVEYTVKLPEGCVSALHRSDITNEEASVSFIGGNDNPIVPIQHVWCSLSDNHPSGTLKEVKFYYNRPVMLSLNPVIKLCDDTDNQIVKEAVPTISKEENQYVMTVDFDTFPLETEKEYAIIIPEGTVVTAHGDITVNERQEIRFTRMMSGVDAARSNSIKIAGADGTITVSNAPEGAIVQVFTPDGKVVSSEKAKTEPLTIEGLSRGIYIVRTGGIVRSVLLK